MSSSTSLAVQGVTLPLRITVYICFAFCRSSVWSDAQKRSLPSLISKQKSDFSWRYRRRYKRYLNVRGTGVGWVCCLIGDIYFYSPLMFDAKSVGEHEFADKSIISQFLCGCFCKNTPWFFRVCTTVSVIVNKKNENEFPNTIIKSRVFRLKF